MYYVIRSCDQHHSYEFIAGAWVLSYVHCMGAWRIQGGKKKQVMSSMYLCNQLYDPTSFLDFVLGPF